MAAFFNLIGKNSQTANGAGFASIFLPGVFPSAEKFSKIKCKRRGDAT
jgi:hypothetical protein